VWRSKAQNKTGYRKSKFQPGFVKEKRKFRPLSKFEIPILVENLSLIAYRDTGSDRSFVQAQLFPNVVITGKIDIFVINDKDPVSVPTAMVTVKSPVLGAKEIHLEVGLLKHLHWQFLLGNNAFEEKNLQDFVRVDLKPVDGNAISTTKTNDTADEAAANSKRSVFHTGSQTQVTSADRTTAATAQRTLQSRLHGRRL